jgi:hypothetical protein
MKSISIMSKRGRPRKRPETVYADTKYDMPLDRFYLDGKSIRSQTPSSTNRKRGPGRPRAYDKAAYDGVRPSIERFLSWMKAFKRVIIRYDRLPNVYMGLAGPALVEFTRGFFVSFP